ncbi:MAG: NUDIX hydrolase [Magnetococcales bacterium]|nr:NUDIX hydrolase [Magnetococcales bacterium]
MHTPETPFLAADTIIELLDHAPPYPIVLVERRFAPLGMAIPGGFVERGERMEQAAVREAAEETSLDVTLTALLGLYSDPQRDRRGHTVTAVYVGQAHGLPVAADDAKSILILAPEQALTQPLTFDHARVLQDYLHWRATGQPAPLSLESRM